MLNKSRSDIYDYLYGLFYGTVTENVYSMSEPQELEDTDRTDGFIVLHVGNMYDNSEFSGQTYGEVRCYVEAYIPPVTRGRLDVDKYREYESAITQTIENAIASPNQNEDYCIQEDSLISSETEEVTNANNIFFVFIKSFIVVINKNI